MRKGNPENHSWRLLAVYSGEGHSAGDCTHWPCSKHARWLLSASFQNDWLRARTQPRSGRADTTQIWGIAPSSEARLSPLHSLTTSETKNKVQKQEWIDSYWEPKEPRAKMCVSLGLKTSPGRRWALSPGIAYQAPRPLFPTYFTWLDACTRLPRPRSDNGRHAVLPSGSCRPFPAMDVCWSHRIQSWAAATLHCCLSLSSLHFCFSFPPSTPVSSPSSRTCPSTLQNSTGELSFLPPFFRKTSNVCFWNFNKHRKAQKRKQKHPGFLPQRGTYCWHCILQGLFFLSNCIIISIFIIHNVYTCYPVILFNFWHGNILLQHDFQWLHSITFYEYTVFFKTHHLLLDI